MGFRVKGVGSTGDSRGQGLRVWDVAFKGQGSKFGPRTEALAQATQPPASVLLLAKPGPPLALHSDPSK